MILSYADILGASLVKNDEYAWSAEKFSYVLDYARAHNYVILGGDVVTEYFEYTGENWFYQIKAESQFLAFQEANVKNSLAVAARYVSNYKDSNRFFVPTLEEAPAVYMRSLSHME